MVNNENYTLFHYLIFQNYTQFVWSMVRAKRVNVKSLWRRQATSASAIRVITAAAASTLILASYRPALTAAPAFQPVSLHPNSVEKLIMSLPVVDSSAASAMKAGQEMIAQYRINVPAVPALIMAPAQSKFISLLKLFLFTVQTMKKSFYFNFLVRLV